MRFVTPNKFRVKSQLTRIFFSSQVNKRRKMDNAPFVFYGNAISSLILFLCSHSSCLFHFLCACVESRKGGESVGHVSGSDLLGAFFTTIDEQKGMIEREKLLYPLNVGMRNSRFLCSISEKTNKHEGHMLAK